MLLATVTGAPSCTQSADDIGYGDLSPYGFTNTELGNDTQEQLYNMITDKGEKNNLATQQPNEVTRLKGILDNVQNMN